MSLNKSTEKKAKWTKSVKILVEALLYFSIGALFILFTFRKVRSFFPPPSIGESKIVGYAQYFGYPFYFDTVLFFVFLLSPILIFAFIKFRRRYEI